MRSSSGFEIFSKVEVQIARLLSTALFRRISTVFGSPTWSQDILQVRRCLKTPDLWWSAKLALLLAVRKEYLNDQIAKSINLRSDYFEQIAYALPGKKYHSSRAFAMYSQIRDIFPTTQDNTRLYEGGQDSSEPVDVQNVSLLASSVQLAEEKISNPSQRFELTMAVG